MDDAFDLVELREMGRINVFFSKTRSKGKYLAGWFGMIVQISDGVDCGMGS